MPTIRTRHSVLWMNINFFVLKFVLICSMKYTKDTTCHRITLNPLNQFNGPQRKMKIHEHTSLILGHLEMKSEAL